MRTIYLLLVRVLKNWMLYWQIQSEAFRRWAEKAGHQYWTESWMEFFKKFPMLS